MCAHPCTEHAYCLSYRFLNNVVITTVIEMLNWLKYSMEDLVNVLSRTSRRIYRLALPLRAPETLSSLSKSRISIFNDIRPLYFRDQIDLERSVAVWRQRFHRGRGLFLLHVLAVVTGFYMLKVPNWESLPPKY